MKLTIHRDIHDPKFALGVLKVDGKDFGYTCEDTDRGLYKAMSLDDIRKVKIKGRTAIPTGTYRVYRTWSPKYQKHMMLVSEVPGYQGIRIHPGNDHSDTEGCLLPGLTRDPARGRVDSSRFAWSWLDGRIDSLLREGELVDITISSEREPWRSQ